MYTFVCKKAHLKEGQYMKKTVKILIMMIVIIALATAMTACTPLLNSLLNYDGDNTDNTTLTPPTTPDGECVHDSNSSHTGYSSPTCLEEGYYFKACMYCGEFYRVGDPIPKLEHSLRLAGDYAGDCKINGYTGDIECGMCGQVFEEGQVIETIGIRHVNIVATTFDFPGDCTSNGRISGRKCLDCGELVSSSISLPMNPQNHVETRIANNVQYCLSCNMVTSGSFLSHTLDVHCCTIILPEATYCTGCGQIIYNPDCEHMNVKIYTNNHYGYKYTYCSNCFYIVEKPECDNHSRDAKWYKCDNCGGTDCAHSNVIQVFNTLQCGNCGELLEVNPCDHSETTTFIECIIWDINDKIPVKPLTFCNGCGMFMSLPEQCDHSHAYIQNEISGYNWLWCPDCKEYLNK